MNFGNLKNILSRIIFILFSIVLLGELFAIYHISSVSVSTVAVPGAIFFLTLFSPFFGIFIFVASVALLSGLAVIHGGMDLSLAFSGLFFAWLLRRLLAKKYFSCKDPSAFFTYLLILIILLNLSLVLGRSLEWSTVSRMWLEWFSHVPFYRQGDIMWQVNAALILLKGLFLFRMIVEEIDTQRKWSLFIKTIYIQGFVIACFSIYQLIQFKSCGEEYLGLTLPFTDIHSYGSAVVLLFGIFLCLMLNNSKGYRKRGLWSSVVSLNGFFAVLFFLLCLYSSSRVTWLVACGLVLWIFLSSFSRKKLFVILSLLLASFMACGFFFGARLLHSDNQSLHRLGTVLDVTNIRNDTALQVRFELWKRAVKMIEEYPLTGIGIGNAYRNSQSFKTRYVGQWDVENSHNYYLQLAAELGLPSALLLLLLLFTLFLPPPSNVSSNNYTDQNKHSLLPYYCGFGMYLITMFTGHALLLVSHQFMFWPVAAILSSGRQLENDELIVSHRVNYKILKGVGVVSFLLFFCGFLVNVYKKDPWTIPAGYGFYSEEYWNGSSMRWMCGTAEYWLPAEQSRLTLQIVAHPINSQPPEGLHVAISLNDVKVDTLYFVNGGRKVVSYDLSRFADQAVKVTLFTDRYFCLRTLGVNGDSRTLGVAVGELEHPLPLMAIPILLLE